MEIVNKYSKQIQYIISEPDGGVYDAFNKGIKASTGDIIYFLNSDDFLVKNNIIEQVAEVFMLNPTVKMVYGKIKAVNKDLNMTHDYGKRIDIEDLKKGEMLAHQGFFAKKELYIMNNCFDLRYKIMSDFDVVIKMFKEYSEESLFINQPIAYFRLGGVSSNRYKVYEEIYKITKKHFTMPYTTSTSISQLNMEFYKRWISLLTQGITIGDKLHEQNIRRIVIFGSMDTTKLLAQELQNSLIEIVAILDNNKKRQTQSIFDIEIHDPTWLKDKFWNIDAVILSFEGAYEEQVRKQLQEICSSNELPTYSWREVLYI